MDPEEVILGLVDCSELVSLHLRPCPFRETSGRDDDNCSMIGGGLMAEFCDKMDEEEDDSCIFWSSRGIQMHRIIS